MLSQSNHRQIIGAVVIGRNEGERLRACLESLVDHVLGLVYVDSGSTDNSMQIVSDLGVMAVELDMSVPFTAARARNKGFSVLMQYYPEIKYIQFVDGDCEVPGGWFECACYILDEQQQVAVVCGRRRERYPDRTIYNQLCDIEWDAVVGDIIECGGDMLARLEPFQNVDGFNAELIAGEEPELCVRLRERGWKIHRIECDMTIHDAAMFHFSQWWKRAIRAGYAFAEINKLHRSSSCRIWKKEEKSNWLWGMSLPLIALLSCYNFIWAGLIVVYPLQILRIVISAKKNRTLKERVYYAFFCVLQKFPNMIGQAKFCIDFLSYRKSEIIEYK